MANAHTLRADDDAMARGTFEARVSAITSHIIRRLADAAVQDMRARYDFGRVLEMVRRSGRGEMGAGMLRRIADVLQTHTSALRRYARVSETIPPQEFAWLTRLTNERGVPLTWSHVELLARVRSAERRKQLAAAVMERNLSVRALAALVRAARP